MSASGPACSEIDHKTSLCPPVALRARRSMINVAMSARSPCELRCWSNVTMPRSRTSSEIDHKNIKRRYVHQQPLKQQRTDIGNIKSTPDGWKIMSLQVSKNDKQRRPMHVTSRKISSVRWLSKKENNDLAIENQFGAIKHPVMWVVYCSYPAPVPIRIYEMD